MRVKLVLVSLFLLSIGQCATFIKNQQQNKSMSRQEAEPRKLYENTTSSFLLGDAGSTSSTHHLNMLINQQKAMQNYKTVNGWLSDLEQRLDDLRDTVNRRISDFAIGLQRRNMMMSHYNYMGQTAGSTLPDVGGQNMLSY